MKDLRFIEKMIQGRIGKRFVIKHYKKYKVKTKVPDMSGIIPSTRQKRQRRLFRLAVQYAQEIYWDPKKRAEKERIYRRPWRLFQKLMKEWFKKRQAKREAARRRLSLWRRNVALTYKSSWVATEIAVLAHPLFPRISWRQKTGYVYALQVDYQ